MENDPAFVKEIQAKAAQGDEACKAASVCLQAMRSVICANLAAPSAAAYFAGSVAALQKEGEQKGSATSRVAALLLILRKAIPGIAPCAVGARLNDLALAITGVLRQSDDESIVRQALGCLMAAADAVYGGGGRPNRKVLKPIFAFLGDQRSVVRHQAELSATMIMRRAAAVGDQQSLDFAVQHLGQQLAAGRGTKKDVDEVPAKRALTLIRAVGPVLPIPSLAMLSEEMLRLPGQLGQHPVCIESFEFLAETVAQQPPEDGPGTERRAALAEFAAKLLPGLMAVPLSMLNVMYVKAYAKAIGSTVGVLCGEQVAPSLPKQVFKQKLGAVRKVLGLFAERDPTILRGARNALVSAFECAGASGDLAMLDELPELCTPLLGFESKGAWRQVLPVVTCIFQALSKIRADRVGVAGAQSWTDLRFQRSRGLLEALVAARDNARGGELAHVFGEQLGECLGSAVSAFGPDRFLTVAELRILETPLTDGAYEQKSRSWLLLVLKTSVRHSSLGFFGTELMPLASALKARSAEAVASNHLVVSRRYATLLEQVWGLLPGFCDEPLDLNAAMMADGGKLAKQLVGVLGSEPELQDHVWAAFRNLCETAREPPTKLSAALQESNRTCLQTLSSRVVPEMFNTYLKEHTDSEGQDATRLGQKRFDALASLQSYVRLADPQLVGNLYKKLVARLLKAVSGEAADEEQKLALPLAELSCAVVPHLAAEFLELTLKVFSPMLSGAASASEEHKDVAQALQKTAYKSVLGVLQHTSVDITDGPVDVRILGLWGTLNESRQTCCPAALKARLACIEAMLKLTNQSVKHRAREPGVKEDFMQCLRGVMPEILFHLRDQSTTVRDGARECLHMATTTALNQELQTEVVTLISAGLAGLTRHSKASAVDALSRLMYEHRAKIADHLQDRLIGVVLLLLQDTDAQVWRSVLKFCKVVVYVVPKSRLEKVLPQLMLMFNSKHLATAKMLMRGIVERLAKVLPAELLAEAFPQGHAPLLQYVQKQLARQERPKSTRAVKEEGQDAEMGGTEEAAPTESWDKFQGEDAEEPAPAAAAPTKGAAAAAPAAGEAGAAKKRGRADEPPTSAVMAHDAVQALLDAWEAESDGSDAEGGGGGGGGRKRVSRAGKRKRDGDGNETTGTWIHEDQDVPLDFMSADAAHSVLTVRPRERKRRRGAEIGPAGATSRLEAMRRSGLRFAEDGRLVIDEEADEPKGEKKAGFTLGADGGKKKPKALSKLAALRKSRLEAKATARAQRRGAHRIKGLDNFKPGKKGAAGDATRETSSLKPYAYVQLNPRVAKEKFKDKATASFSKVLKGAQKGVVKGLKAKQRDAKHRKAKEVKDRRKKAASKVQRGRAR